MSASPLLETLPDALLDTLVSYILQTYPALAVVFLSALSKRVHNAAVRVLFTSIILPDDARCFFASRALHPTSRHPLSAILSNSDRYARAVKRIVITDAELPPPSASVDAEGSLGLVTIEEEDCDDQIVEGQSRVAVQPVPAENLNELIAVCTNLEDFIWSSPNPPPDGVCEVIAEECPRLVNFTFQPDAPLRPSSGTPTPGAPLPAIRSAVPKWDAPSLPLLTALLLTKLHISRLSQQGSRALAVFLNQLGEYSLLEDVSLDFVWLDDPLCEKLAEAGRRIKRLRIGTSGTKLTDKGLVSIFESCDSLEDFGLIEAQGRLTRNLWTKFSTLPAQLRTFKIAISESGPHHSWTADHLLSFSKLQLDVLTHLSVMRIIQPPYFSGSGDNLEYEAHIDDVATLRAIPRDMVAAIRAATALSVLECDWWSWKAEDVKALLERCSHLEYLKLAFDGPFSKLLTLTSAFTPLTRLLKLSVAIPPAHAPGPIPIPTSPALEMSPTHPLTPAASPVRRRTSLPSPDSDTLSHFFTDDTKLSGPADPSLPPTREVKRFVKKCPRLVELEWYGRNARGKWLISRSVTTSKINTNVNVEYHPPVASSSVWKRASRERAIAEVVQLGGSLSQNIERQGQTWIGLKAEQFFADRAIEKEKEDTASPEKRMNGVNKRSSSSLASVSASASTTTSTDRQSGPNHSPVQPFTPLSPPTSTKSFAATYDHTPVSASETTPKLSGQSAQSPKRAPPSEPSLSTNGISSSRARSASGSAQGGSGSSTSRGRTSSSGGGHRDGRGRGGNSSGKPGGGGGGPRRNTTANGAGSVRNGAGGGRGHGASRGGKRKTPVSAN